VRLLRTTATSGSPETIIDLAVPFDPCAWRDLPLSDVHPHAELAAEASEAAAAQGAF
jgi:hypothetical protein